MVTLINNIEVIYQVNYSNGKKLTLELNPEGLVIIKAPLRTSSEDILAFLNKNSKEILAFLKRLDNRIFVSSKKEYLEEENYLYLGKASKLSDMIEHISDSEEENRKQLELFYTKKTKAIIKERVRYYESVIGVKAKSITVTRSQSSWGTCNSNKELTFNYRLSMAPMSCIDYVVIHELCHIYHLNHDRSFWRKVGSFDQHFEEHEAYLARYSSVMTI